MKILITGASGLLGRHLVPLLTSEHTIYAVGRTPVPNTASLPPIDFSKKWDIADLPKSIDVIIHLAQSPEYRNFPEGAPDVFRINVESTAKLLDYAHKANAKKFILASTGGIYRPGLSPITDDSEILGPGELTYYFASKLSSEMFAGAYRPFFDVTTLRIFFMFGPNQRREMFLPSLIDKVRLGKPIFLNGSDGIQVNPVHAGDVAQIVKSLSQNRLQRTINVGGPETVSIKSLAMNIGQIIGKEPNFVTKGEALDLVVDTADLQRKTGYPKVRISDSLKALCQ